MAHEIMQEDSLFYVLKDGVPWHGLGQPVPEAATSKEAIIAAGLDWEVELCPAYYFMDQTNGPFEDREHFVIARKDNNKSLGVVGNRYTPIQNIDSFSFMDSLVEDGSLRYHTAGSFRNGKRIWLLGKIGSFEVVPKDKVDQYLFLFNTHDGTGTLKVMFTPIRVICANTARIALDGAGKDYVSIKHTANLYRNLEASKEVLGIAKQAYSNFEEFTKYISKINLTTNRAKELIEHIVPMPSDKMLRASSIAENKRVEIFNLFDHGVGQDIPGVSGTGWALYNSITEYMNFHAPVRGKTEEIKQEHRFENVMFSDNKLLERTTKILMAA